MKGNATPGGVQLGLFTSLGVALPPCNYTFGRELSNTDATRERRERNAKSRPTTGRGSRLVTTLSISLKHPARRENWMPVAMPYFATSPKSGEFLSDVSCDERRTRGALQEPRAPPPMWWEKLGEHAYECRRNRRKGIREDTLTLKAQALAPSSRRRHTRSVAILLKRSLVGEHLLCGVKQVSPGDRNDC